MAEICDLATIFKVSMKPRRMKIADD